jgi:periplasmic protein TonB
MRSRIDAPLPMLGALPASSGGAGSRVGLGASAAAHAVALATLVLAPLLSREALPRPPDYLRARLGAPGAAAPPPPPQGSPLAGATAPTRPLPSTAQPATATPLSQETMATDTAAPSPPLEQTMEAWGRATGDPAGDGEGIEGGVRGGTVGGLPGGAPDGGGDGGLPVPVRDYDRPPRPLTQARPVYPPDAFTKKIEGTVLTEILIGADGRVLKARVVKSVPVLDEAALAAVRQWTFAPAVKNGRPVATLATAPVSFRIY